ncbi:DUF1609 domain-containing protein [Encephalitozoon intestinalis]|nr:DUF1609 domain-containing protein [Encephalitozoon intestinalis]
MKWQKVLVTGFFDVIICASVESSSEGLPGSIVETGRPGMRASVFPLLFKGNGLLIARPTTRFSDLKKNPSIMEDVREFIENGRLTYLVWLLGVGDSLHDKDDWFNDIFFNNIVAYLKEVSLDLWKMYEKTNKTLGELLVMGYERILQCEKSHTREMEKFGEIIIKEAERIMKEAEKEEDEEKKRKKIAGCHSGIKYARMLLNRSLWKNVMDAEKIICEECSKLYETPEEIELMGFMAEGNIKSLLKEGSIIGEDPQRYKYLECSMIPIELLLDTDKTKGRDVVKELIKQIMMGKDEGEIDHKYINEVSDVVRRRRKAEERRRLKIEKELLGESEDSGGRKKKKSRGGGRKKRLAAEEKKEEEGEKEEEEELVGAVGGVSISSDSGKSKGKQSERPNYKLHKRITRWSKDADKIKEELDSGKEEKWKGKSIKEIRKQKEVHDIAEVVDLLRSPDASRFFMDLGGGENRIQKMATATLERGGKKETGILEVGIFKNEKGDHVIYHLMFRATKVEEMRSVMSSLVAEKGDLSEEQMSEGEGEFMYPSGVRCSTLKEEGKFRVEYRNPRNTDEVLRRLTVLARPKIL